jgi:hypothetical protein
MRGGEIVGKRIERPCHIRRESQPRGFVLIST